MDFLKAVAAIALGTHVSKQLSKSEPAMEWSEYLGICFIILFIVGVVLYHINT